MNEIDVTSIGDINIDLITSNLEELPGRDSQVVVDDLAMSSGGCAANFAKAVSRLGLRARFIGKVGDDLYAEYLRDSLLDVDLRLSPGSRTGLTYALTLDDGSRSFITYPGANAEFRVGDIDLRLIEGGFLHVASFFLQGLRGKTRDVLEYAHGRDMLTSFDTGWDPAGWGERDRRLVLDMLPEVDIFFPNISEAKALSGSDDVDGMCEKLLDLGPGIIALKMGSKGSLITSRDERIVVKPFTVDVVDSTGAGDVFAAAFIFGQHRGYSLQECGRFANAAAALSTRYPGSCNYPSEKEVTGFMRDYPGL